MLLVPPALRGQAPDQVGQWSGITTLPLVPIHVALLPNGNVLLWNHGHAEYVDSAGKRFVKDYPTPYVWDYKAPANPILVSVPELFANGTHSDEIYCSAHSFLPDGRLLVAGGHMSKWNSDALGKPINLEFTGSRQIHFFDFRVSPGPASWFLQSTEMSDGRWYPSTMPLGNGNHLVIGGIIDQVLDGAGQPVPGQYEYSLRPDIYDSSTGTLTTLTNVSRRLPTYPWMYPAASATPGAKAFYAGPGPDTNFLNLTGQGSWGAVIMSSFGTSRSPGPIHQSASVLYDEYKVLNVGGVNMAGFSDNGSAPTTASAEIIDLNVSVPAWRAVPGMNRPRQHHTATLLPDGKVLVTGGKTASGFDSAAGAVMEAEMWDPATQSWSLLASMSVPRLHHSFALLLPDGRVMVGGGGETGFPNEQSHPDVQFYSPPYLFKGARPVITSVSSQTIAYGQQFSIQTDAKSINKVVLIRLGSVSHGFNLNQSVGQLKFKKNGNNGLAVTAPTDRNLVPPGHYLLFIVNNAGTPSIATIVQVG